MTDLALLQAAIDEALQAADDADAVTGVCAACVARLPCDGAAVTVMASDSQRQTVYASDEVIAAFERAQYSLGEGPSLVAFTQRRPALVSHIDDSATLARWPGLAREVANLDVGSVFCFPMRLGVINVGICAFYRREPGTLSTEDVSSVLEVLELTTLALLELRDGDGTEHLLGRWLSGAGHSRRLVHQATGMVMGQLGVPAEVAFARLRASAYSQGRDVEQVATEIVNRSLRLDEDTG
ncbi:MAG: GAF and ANTAR domain-containing protein [Nocardioidaceae bacterium]